ncbi:MAG TPA: phosphotransferase, partial [Solirubrobacteraceae bacterium]|nr:phosphotransferase [Solirubrobacteraceae bacterium]
HALGLAPELVLFLPEHGCLVTRFAAGPAAEPGDVRRPEVLAGVARHLRAFHGGPALPVRFDVIALGERHRELVRARGGTVPPAYDEAARLAARIAATLGGAEHALVPCHNDLLPSNFILPAGGPITIVDWEYAGMNDRYFDLGNLAVNNELSPADEQLLLEAYWEEPASERRLATLSLMRIFSDYREASWGLAQTVLSELDFDFPAYADKHLARMLDAAAGPDLEGWLRAATA